VFTGSRSRRPETIQKTRFGPLAFSGPPRGTRRTRWSIALGAAGRPVPRTACAPRGRPTCGKPASVRPPALGSVRSRRAARQAREAGRTLDDDGVDPQMPNVRMVRDSLGTRRRSARCTRQTVKVQWSIGRPCSSLTPHPDSRTPAHIKEIFDAAFKRPKPNAPKWVASRNGISRRTLTCALPLGISEKRACASQPRPPSAAMPLCSR